MSLIKRSDVKNHLSARHRTEMHLAPESQADATGFPHDEDVDSGSSETDGMENPVRSPSSSSGEQQHTAIVPSTSILN